MAPLPASDATRCIKRGRRRKAVHVVKLYQSPRSSPSPPPVASNGRRQSFLRPKRPSRPRVDQPAQLAADGSLASASESGTLSENEMHERTPRRGSMHEKRIKLLQPSRTRARANSASHYISSSRPSRYITPPLSPSKTPFWRVRALRIHRIPPRRFAEVVMLFIPLVFCCFRFLDEGDLVPVYELSFVAVTSIFTLIVSHAFGSRDTFTFPDSTRERTSLPMSPQSSSQGRETKRQLFTASSVVPTPPSPHLVYMTHLRNYRPSTDSGFITAALLGPTVAAAMLLQVTTQTGLPRLTSTLSSISSNSSPASYLNQHQSASVPVPPSWLAEPPLSASSSLSPLAALIQSRYALLQITSLCSFILSAHVVMSAIRQRRLALLGRKDTTILPPRESQRMAMLVFFTASLTTGLAVAGGFLESLNLWNPWLDLSRREIVLVSILYQALLYALVRMGGGGFTLGEAGLVAQAVTGLLLETLNLTQFLIHPTTTPYIKTFRFPTPLLTYQLALIIGSLLCGLILSPILVLSRSIAQQPLRRLRKSPAQKDMQRRFLAGSFYLGVALIVVVVVGWWTGTALGAGARVTEHGEPWRDPWMWVLHWVLWTTPESSEQHGPANANTEPAWSWNLVRLGLIAYWVALVGLAILGWMTSFRYVGRRARGHVSGGTPSSSISIAMTRSPSRSSSTTANSNMGSTTSHPHTQLYPVHSYHPPQQQLHASSTPPLPTSYTPLNGSSAPLTALPTNPTSSKHINSPMIEVLPALDNSKAPPSPVTGVDDNDDPYNLDALPSRPRRTRGGRGGVMSMMMGLNGRRKSFHAIAVLMFAPGILIDPAFQHLAFSLAFAIFIFAEYIRYFALYPFGAAVHIFLSEFLDEKDKGSVILSHFYLLLGCAGMLWLESSSRLLDLTGVLVLGVGDSLASIVGKRYGKHKWFELNKSVEGSVAFVFSVVGSAKVLEVLGLVDISDSFRGWWGYAIAASAAACLEGWSLQNDNLVLPVYMWSLKKTKKKQSFSKYELLIGSQRFIMRDWRPIPLLRREVSNSGDGTELEGEKGGVRVIESHAQVLMITPHAGDDDSATIDYEGDAETRSSSAAVAATTGKEENAPAVTSSEATLTVSTAQTPNTSDTSSSNPPSPTTISSGPRRAPGMAMGIGLSRVYNMHSMAPSHVHVRSPLAQTPSPVPSDDNPLSPGPSLLPSILSAPSTLASTSAGTETVTVPLVANPANVLPPGTNDAHVPDRDHLLLQASNTAAASSSASSSIPPPPSPPHTTMLATLAPSLPPSSSPTTMTHAPSSSPLAGNSTAVPTTRYPVMADSSSHKALTSTSIASEEQDPLTWADFLHLYASGKWDPSRPPPKPSATPLTTRGAASAAAGGGGGSGGGPGSTTQPSMLRRKSISDPNISLSHALAASSSSSAAADPTASTSTNSHHHHHDPHSRSRYKGAVGGGTDQRNQPSPPPLLANAGRTRSSPDSSSSSSTTSPPHHGSSHYLHGLGGGTRSTILQRRGAAAEQFSLGSFAPSSSSSTSDHHLNMGPGAKGEVPSPSGMSRWATGLGLGDAARTPSPPVITPAALTDAATVRWAGARVKIAPLALSSPERMLLYFLFFVIFWVAPPLSWVWTSLCMAAAYVLVRLLSPFLGGFLDDGWLALSSVAAVLGFPSLFLSLSLYRFDFSATSQVRLAIPKGILVLLAFLFSLGTGELLDPLSDYVTGLPTPQQKAMREYFAANPNVPPSRILQQQHQRPGSPSTSSGSGFFGLPAARTGSGAGGVGVGVGGVGPASLGASASSTALPGAGGPSGSGTGPGHMHSRLALASSRDVVVAAGVQEADANANGVDNDVTRTGGGGDDAEEEQEMETTTPPYTRSFISGPITGTATRQMNEYFAEVLVPSVPNPNTLESSSASFSSFTPHHSPTHSRSQLHRGSNSGLESLLGGSSRHSPSHGLSALPLGSPGSVGGMLPTTPAAIVTAAAAVNSGLSGLGDEGYFASPAYMARFESAAAGDSAATASINLAPEIEHSGARVTASPVGMMGTCDLPVVGFASSSSGPPRQAQAQATAFLATPGPEVTVSSVASTTSAEPSTSTSAPSLAPTSVAENFARLTLRTHATPSTPALSRAATSTSSNPPSRPHLLSSSTGSAPSPPPFSGAFVSQDPSSLSTPPLSTHRIPPSHGPSPSLSTPPPASQSRNKVQRPQRPSTASSSNLRSAGATTSSAPANATTSSPTSQSSHHHYPHSVVPLSREEALFHEKNYLIPPLPPNEIERRTALHKFNILHTAPDVNFDRIAHLAKLVFHARWVFIILVDKDEQFFKHSSGLPFNSGARESSFCTHTILQEDEPMVVLDASKDWRFSNNPNVTTTTDPSDPNYLKVAFYAGTPLKTADGFNVGSLCIVDDTPRTEFTPRQRHALKEFGAIVMREMELWRDKVQLRIRDRIQTSMEQFTRECLELDGASSEAPGVSSSATPVPSTSALGSGPAAGSPSPTSGPSSSSSPDLSMKRVYSNAASLVKSTLDLEGAVVLDVSNFEIIHHSAGGAATVSASGVSSSASSSTPGSSGGKKIYHGDLFNSALNSPASKMMMGLGGAGGAQPNEDSERDEDSESASAVENDDVDPLESLARARKGASGMSSTVSGHEYGRIPALPVLGAAENSQTSPSADASKKKRHEPLSGEAHAQLASFLSDYPDGRIYEGIVPSCFRGIVPSNLQYAMVVPIFNVDGQPFILLCGYTTDRTKHFLEGFEMQYLRAIGVIILSAVLKRRMKLADKAKSLFISNISHELRTPLHGILAAAELLAESGLSPNQQAYLQTVEACGTSLVETVNHVLDFSKLSGTTKSISIKRATTDLVGLLEDTVEGSWVGARARANYGNADIGSAYSPPKSKSAANTMSASHLGEGVEADGAIENGVETVLDIGFRDQGWLLKCEKGGIRRVLMNLMGNSLKFTDTGFVHITLRELPPEPGSSYVRLELAVLDSGKGISKDFLKNQMFQPFSQENPHHTGTGLGLAIVNSIVKSEGIRGKVDVYSAEGVGTEIRVTIEAEQPSRSSFSRQGLSDDLTPLTRRDLSHAKIHLLSFSPMHRGQDLLRTVLSSYMTDWWHASVVESPEEANVLLINEDVVPLAELIRTHDTSKPVVLLASQRGGGPLAKAAVEFQSIGGICHTIYKPVRPSRLFQALHRALGPSHSDQSSPISQAPLHRPHMTQKPSLFSAEEVATAAREAAEAAVADPTNPLPSKSSDIVPLVQRRHSSEAHTPPRRPPLTHTMTYDNFVRSETLEPNTLHESPSQPVGSSMNIEGTGLGTSTTRSPRVLIVEDNHVNRALLAQWLKRQGYEYEEAVDGQAGVDVFNSRPPGHFDVLLVDMSMPVLDGAGAIQMIRSIEQLRNGEDASPSEEHPNASSGITTPKRSKIFALSGLASKEDKLRAFNAGVDGYLVKPVSFKTLTTVFARLEGQI
ncbi:hypothetical protein DL93DRAFT_2102769 [Clavulina sp. PMI_390]|nr:hypothetical protein DL93DRAFT_2102769 [Clavulina sp. PMI_390]